MPYSFTKDTFVSLVRSSHSIREVLEALGLRPAGSNYATFHKAVKEWSIDTSHFRRTHDVTSRVPLEEYFTKTYTQTHRFKQRLIQEGYFSNACQLCGISTWRGYPVPLHLHHIDGNPSNNILSNITLLCPNCHAITPSFRKRKTLLSKYSRNTCKTCGAKISRQSVHCHKCSSLLQRRAVYPDLDTLFEEARSLGYEATGRKYGVSGTTIKKHLLKGGKLR